MTKPQPKTLLTTIEKAIELVHKIIVDKNDRKQLSFMLLDVAKKIPSIIKKQEINKMGKTFKDGDKSKKVIKRVDKTKPMSVKEYVKKKGKK